MDPGRGPPLLREPQPRAQPFGGSHSPRPLEPFVPKPAPEVQLRSDQFRVNLQCQMTDQIRTSPSFHQLFIRAISLPFSANWTLQLAPSPGPIIASILPCYCPTFWPPRRANSPQSSFPQFCPSPHPVATSYYASRTMEPSSRPRASRGAQVLHPLAELRRQFPGLYSRVALDHPRLHPGTSGV